MVVSSSKADSTIAAARNRDPTVLARNDDRAGRRAGRSTVRHHFAQAAQTGAVHVLFVLEVPGNDDGVGLPLMPVRY